MKKNKEEKFGEIKILSEKEETFIKMDVEMDDYSYEILLDYAKKNIFSDEEACISWAVCKILTDSIEQKESLKMLSKKKVSKPKAKTKKK